MSDNQASKNPYQNYALTPGQKYSPAQLWNQKPREMAGPNEASMEASLASKMAEREAFQFPYPKPDADNMVTFQPMQGPMFVSHHDEHFTPLAGAAAAPTYGPRPVFGNTSAGSDSAVLRLLLGQLRSSVQASVDSLNAIETLLNQQETARK